MLKFMGQAQRQRDKVGEFGEEAKLPYFMGQVQYEPNFNFAFGDKAAYPMGFILSNGILMEFLFFFLVCNRIAVIRNNCVNKKKKRN